MMPASNSGKAHRRRADKDPVRETPDFAPVIATERTGRPAPDKVGKLSWRDYELLLLLSEAGSIRECSVRLKCHVKTIRQRLARMEDLLGEKLVTRGRGGSPMTKAGTRLLQVAKHMRMTINAGEQDLSAEKKHLKIAATEGLGSYWLMPRLVEFQTANPDLQVTLACDMQRVDLGETDFDIAVQLEPVTSAALLPTRLGTLHLMPFAAASYLRRAGTPQSVDDWPHHRLVWQEADQVASELLPFHIGTHDPAHLIAIRTNNSSAHFRAVAAGGGIGILPTYARAISRKVRPLDINVHLKREITCVVRAQEAHMPHIARGIAWLREAFSCEQCPWFEDRFVHPDEFEISISTSNVISLFEGFIDGIDPGLS